MISEIELNLSALSTIEAPSFNATNQSIAEFMNNIPIVANNMTDGYFGIIILFFLTIGVFWILTEKSQFGKFQYSNLKGLTIALSISCIMGANALQMGYFVNFVHFVWINALYMIFLIWHIITDRR